MNSANKGMEMENFHFKIVKLKGNSMVKHREHERSGGGNIGKVA